MPRIELETPEAQELTALVLAKLNDFGWTDNTVLANFIVVMVANDKTKPEIIEELNDILPGQGPEFADWLFQVLDSASAPATEQMQAPSTQSHVEEMVEQDLEPMDPTSTRQRSSGAKAPGRLLQNAITSATRSEARAPARQAPARVYEDDRRDRRTPREHSTSPVRSTEGLTTRSHQDDRIQFRRSSEDRARDEARIDARLGNGARGQASDRDRLRGRLGRIEDRLGKRADETNFSSHRERSWDRNSDYHDRRGGRNNKGRKNDALRDIERRLGTRPVYDDSNNNGGDDDLENVPRQPASWSRNPERMLRMEAEMTREAVADETLNIIQNNNIKRCKFWPNCEKGELCPFWHPKELCADYPNCPNSADTCLYVHPLAEPTAEQLAAARRQALMQSMRSKSSGGDIAVNPMGTAMQMPFALGSQALHECKFGARCTRADCKFRHSDRESKNMQQPQQQQCRFYPNCTKPNCPFYHPSYGEPLAGQDSAMDESVTGTGTAPSTEVANRLPTPCRFGDMCTRPGCHFMHPRDGAASTMPMCKFNPCTRPGCPFRHSHGAASGSMGGHINRTLILNGTKPKISERFAGGVVDESEVEKLHVPASTHWANGGVSHQPQPDQQQQQHIDEVARAAEARAEAEMDIDM
ncbi:hypothetical protein BGX28_003818 [Mortierella sp. GBA30]|nr:hypothetical protein BGX28_003818 [Mortierella sp. GBA30]